MIPAERRELRRTNLVGGNALAELLQTVLLAELLEPSPCLWLVSPWISDIVVFDNTTLAFDLLSDEWAGRRVRLSEVVRHRVESGVGTVIATRLSEDSNRLFVEAIRRIERDVKAGHGGVRLIDETNLHEKGIASQRFYLSGSLNITWSGVHVLDERAVLTTEAGDVTSAVMSFTERFGAV